MNREDKLKELEERNEKRNNPQKVALITGDAFSDVLQEKIDDFRDTLERGVEITNLEDLLEQLGLVQSFQAEVKSLKDAIKDHKLPDSIAVTGLELLTEKLKALGQLSKVADSLNQLDNSFQSLTKAINDDIYARYDWSNSGVEPTGQYIGYLAQSGSWFIQRIGEAVNGDKSSTFAAGKNDYKANWQIKSRLKYVSRDKVTIA